MSDTAIVYDEGFLRHIPYPGNPEVPERVGLAFKHLEKCGILADLEVVTPPMVKDEDLLLVHSEKHIEYIYTLSKNGYDDFAVMNTDVYVGEGTFDAARLSSGGVVEAARRVTEGEFARCFCLNRPPGHHASTRLPAGFCYFNNTAVAIRTLQRDHDIQRVAIFDWDAHCGNGTMEIFYEDADVITISAHQDPSMFYPGTGFANQIGEGDGKRACANFPLQPGAGDDDYLYVIDKLAEKLIRDFDPDFLFVAAGQDSSIHDAMSALEVTDEGYMRMTQRMMDIADSVCDGRLVLTLEGGYNLNKMPVTIEGILSVLCGHHPPEKENIVEPAKDEIEGEEKSEPEYKEGGLMEATVDVVDRVRGLL